MLSCLEETSFKKELNISPNLRFSIHTFHYFIHDEYMFLSELKQF